VADNPSPLSNVPGTSPSTSPTPAQAFPVHPLVSDLVPDDAGIPIPSVAFTGFFGNSSKQGYMRLYLTEVLHEYLEIALSDILHTQVLPPPNSALGASRVWVMQNASVQHTVVATRIAQADLIQADLSESENQCAAEGIAPSQGSAGGGPTIYAQSTAINTSRSNVKNN
jgi:hypothetical protein